jgi:diaminohydroxyphosphoribosylaminopyrimidine deaminase/5-amino-6-(5-phosphoribosylamino)uracil reductase
MDNPRLTVRHPQWNGKAILRAVVDSELRIPMHARILETLGQGEVCVLTTRKASSKKEKALRKIGVEVARLPAAPGGIDLAAALAWLGKKGVASLLVEGGSRLFTAMVEEKLADRLFLTVSPKLVGGQKACSFLEGRGVGRIAEAAGIQEPTTYTIGDDIILEGHF